LYAFIFQAVAYISVAIHVRISVHILHIVRILYILASPPTCDYVQPKRGMFRWLTLAKNTDN